jgi:beta-hydroxyacyl-ACP dehydratase FabZ
VENLLNKNITELLPHRKPFLFIDRVISIEGKNKIVAEKKVNKEEDYLKGHFPGNPIVPGVLIVESMAQASGIISAYSLGELQDLYFLSRISDIKFKHPVFPGDTLIIRAEVLGHFDQAVKTRACCEVNGRIVAEGELVLSKMEGKRQ